VTAFDPSTYLPGDPWPTLEHVQRATSPPRISVTGAAANATTSPSYFEFRRGQVGQDQTVEVSVQGTTFDVRLERSFDGVTWQQVSAYTTPTELSLPYTYPAMWRLRVQSGTGVTLGLRQQYQ
jgi:hypothetical protein